jgi:hemerythrin-like metal-binding protein
MTKNTFFRWTDAMSVQLVEIDDQHKELIKMLNEMYDAFMNKEHKTKAGAIVNKMLDYTRYHFTTEEKYFSKFNYSGAVDHIKEHELFRNKVEEFIDKYKKNHSALTYDVMNFLRNWLTTHIMETDRKYISCFKENGVK